jgi:hypothetical protein
MGLRPTGNGRRSRRDHLGNHCPHLPKALHWRHYPAEQHQPARKDTRRQLQ